MKNKGKLSGLISARRYILIHLLFQKEKRFVGVIGASFLVVGIFYPYPQIAMWLGFFFAAYSAISNDSIQTIGTFISSSADKKWWLLWLYIGLIFIGTVTTSWILYDGDISFQRLSFNGFSEAPVSFHFLQIAAPVFLLIITRMKMPVSTTFLLLSSFSSNSDSVSEVFEKSVLGYFIAFTVALFIWMILNRLMSGWFEGKARRRWTVFQWITSGFLWSLWIIQDAANIAVFLPRSLDVIQFLIFTLTIFFGLGLIFYLKGDKIQEIINEKTNVKDVRPATVIDLVYALILILFTWVNTVPMSTTWVFIGLLGGRELGIKISSKEPLTQTWKLIGKDLFYALIGLLVSILVALAANENLREQLFKSFGWIY